MDLIDNEGLERIEKVDWSKVKDLFKDCEVKPTQEMEDILIDYETSYTDDQD